MEWIFYGIMIAIGFYLAPLVIAGTLLALSVCVSVVIAVFQSIFGGNK